jgi:hypothetical protein
MRYIKLSIFIFLAILFFDGSTPSNVPSCREIIDQMIDSIKNIKTQRFYVKATERVGDRILMGEAYSKINVNPRKIYYKNISKNVELLWVQGANKGNAIIHTPQVPFMNLDLDPFGSLMRKDQHHTIFELGTPYIGGVIASTIIKAPKDFDKHFIYAGVITWDKKECYQIIVEYPDYKYVEHTVVKGETVTSIAHKYSTSDFKIRHKNNLSSYFGTIKEGKKLQIPVPYSNKAILYIDKKTYIPINIKVYDEGGIYESYEYYNMKNNLPFAADEFSKDNKEYGFM